MKKVLALFLIVILLASSQTAYAFEDATDISDFSGDYTLQNEYKLWSVFKSLGMNDLQASAALACAKAESNYRAEIIEIGISDGVTGSHAPYGNTEEARDKYLDDYSRNIENADYRTACTDDVMRLHGVSEEDISKAKQGLTSSVPSVYGYNLDVSQYYINGVGYLGCGLYQFTGDGLRKLFAWSKNQNARWFSVDIQIAFFISKDYKSVRLLDFIKTTTESDLDTCVEVFAKAMINGAMPSSQLSTRKTMATEIYERYKNKDWDYRYGERIITKSGISNNGQLGLIEDDTDYDKIIDESLIYSKASNVIRYTTNKGYLLLSNDSIEQANKDVFLSYVSDLQGVETSTKRYSLFELFGEDLHWYRYFGEETYAPNLLDHIWSAIDQDKVDQLISFDTIYYKPYNYLSCQTYNTRPTVLQKSDIEKGKIDPRVTVVKNGFFNGIKYVLGCIKLTIAKYFIAFCALLIGPEIRVVALDIIEQIFGTELWSIISVGLQFILGIVMILFLFSFISKARNYAKGTGSAREAWKRFAVGVCCLGIFYFAIAFPTRFTKLTSNVLHIIDNVFDEALADTIENDEVISVNDETQAIHAVLWKKAIFQPWCRGQFGGLNYEELYTQFAELQKGQSAMPQSHDTINASAKEGTIFYNSADLTGDVYVPVGNGTVIRNWAAYLISCGTKYHIDYTVRDKASEISIYEEPTFPHSTLMTTAQNVNITADTFRVLDAQMDISPQYYPSGGKAENYTGSRELQFEFDLQSTAMIFNSLLVIFMFPVIFQKIISLLMLYFLTLKLVWFSLTELFKEGSGGLAQFWESYKKNFVNYILASMKICLMITLYYLLVDEGAIKTILYIICCIVILSFKWSDIRQAVSKVKSDVKMIKNKI